ncbi:hypothetical protein DVA86_27380 [Streptomyces armeniacus]|uniref:Transposase n=1 Tax=Streptomyces armeniacus TaxID=83291 RepID=A0A345XVY2_9ACTN|nr:hypothetical protein DVA86_27380 [Streptomyces armeniacus]
MAGYLLGRGRCGGVGRGPGGSHVSFTPLRAHRTDSYPVYRFLLAQKTYPTARTGQRLLALATAIWHNWTTGARSKRSLIAYDH